MPLRFVKEAILISFRTYVLISIFLNPSCYG
nr:MAG TPA: Tetrahydrodipicolinate N-succinyltransferase N-terminal [Caudoviricetes sp.]